MLCPPCCSSSTDAQAAQAVAAAAEDCGVVLWCAAGTAAQAELMSAQGSAQDELLQVRQGVRPAGAWCTRSQVGISFQLCKLC